MQFSINASFVYMLLERVVKVPGREYSGTKFLTELNKFSNSFYISSVILTKFGGT